MKKKRWIIAYSIIISLILIVVLARAFIFLYSLKQSYLISKGFYHFEDKNFWEYLKELRKFKKKLRVTTEGFGNRSIDGKRKLDGMTIEDSYGRRYYVPNINLDMGSSEVSTNSIGILGEEVKIPKPEGVYRILILGGSRALSGYPTHPTFSKLLEKGLRERLPGKKLEVVDGSVTGATILNSFMNLVLNWRELDPDMIIIDHGLNDIVTNLDPFYLKNYLFTTKDYMKDIGTDKFEKEKIEEGLDAFRTKLEGLILLARGMNCKVALLNVQVVYGGDFDQRKKIEIYRMLNKGFGVPASYALEIIKGHNKIIKELAQEHDAVFIDVSNALPKSDVFFTDAAHRTFKGNKLYTEVALESLIKSDILNEKQN